MDSLNAVFASNCALFISINDAFSSSNFGRYCPNTSFIFLIPSALSAVPSPVFFTISKRLFISPLCFTKEENSSEAALAVSLIPSFKIRKAPTATAATAVSTPSGLIPTVVLNNRMAAEALVIFPVNNALAALKSNVAAVADFLANSPALVVIVEKIVVLEAALSATI